MSNTDKIFKPRRGTKSNFSSTGSKSNIVLDTGEVFFEVPDTGQGSGRGRIKMGDGITEYSNLPYFLPFTEDEIIVHDGTDTKSITASSSIQSTAIATNLNNAKSGNTLKTIIHNLREAIYKCACDISYLDNSKSSTSHTHSQYSSTSHNHNANYISALETGSSSGTVKYTKNGSTYDIAVKGLESAAYKTSGTFASSSHTHSQYSATNHTHSTYAVKSELGTIYEKSTGSLTFGTGWTHNVSVDFGSYHPKGIYVKSITVTKQNNYSCTFGVDSGGVTAFVTADGNTYGVSGSGVVNISSDERWTGYSLYNSYPGNCNYTIKINLGLLKKT